MTVLFQWVCPGAEGVNSNICPGSGFAVSLSVNGKLAFSAHGIPINGNSPVVPAAPCPRGYLIGSAISDRPNFDGLIGNAVIRGPNLGVGPDAGSSTAVSAYQRSRSRWAPRSPGCWDQVSLASDNSDPQGTGPINTNLTHAFMQTRKGIVIAGPAQKTPELGILDTAGPATLIGLVETIEGTVANSFQERKYDFNMSTNGIPIP